MKKLISVLVSVILTFGFSSGITATAADYTLVEESGYITPLITSMNDGYAATFKPGNYEIRTILPTFGSGELLLKGAKAFCDITDPFHDIMGIGSACNAVDITDFLSENYKKYITYHIVLRDPIDNSWIWEGDLCPDNGEPLYLGDDHPQGYKVYLTVADAEGILDDDNFVSLKITKSK
ncbi:MAG: hypothetical protein LBL80_04210 [Ruminococcus sp.]|jgi:hypothetical protein|nr:hypothetical protein [Ruminococcus sp.]